MQLTYNDFRRILNVGISLSTEKDRNRILESILVNGMETTNCDAGTLYLYENDSLTFKIMKTLSMNISRGVDGEVIDDIPPVPLREENVCAYTAIHGEVVNIADVYHSDRFDFSGPKRYAAMTGFHTQSMLVIPIANNEGQLMGVLQLMNAQDKGGNVIAFDPQFELIIRSLGSLAAIEITNIQYVDEIKEQLHSFVEAMATAIDERTPYNGSHTRKVAEYAGTLAEYMNELHEQGLCEEYFDDNRMEQLLLAALLHDIGKMIVPLNVMNRATRLDQDIEKVDERFLRLHACYEISYLKGEITADEYEQAAGNLNDILAFIHEIDGAGFLNDDNYARVQQIGEMCYESADGTRLPYLTDEEKKCLSIRKGTLTDEARIQMESHVVMTAKILSKVHFNQNYQKVAKWAASHHELLDGSGYPNHLKGDEIELEVRMLTIADVYDALTARDRPYKKAMPKERAFEILKSMANEGKMELRLVEWLEEALAEKKETVCAQ